MSASLPMSRVIGVNLSAAFSVVVADFFENVYHRAGRCRRDGCHSIRSHRTTVRCRQCFCWLAVGVGLRHVALWVRSLCVIWLDEFDRRIQRLVRSCHVHGRLATSEMVESLPLSSSPASVPGDAIVRCGDHCTGRGRTGRWQSGMNLLITHGPG